VANTLAPLGAASVTPPATGKEPGAAANAPAWASALAQAQSEPDVAAGEDSAATAPSISNRSDSNVASRRQSSAVQKAAGFAPPMGDLPAGKKTHAASQPSGQPGGERKQADHDPVSPITAMLLGIHGADATAHKAASPKDTNRADGKAVNKAVNPANMLAPARPSAAHGSDRTPASSKTENAAAPRQTSAPAAHDVPSDSALPGSAMGKPGTTAKNSDPGTGTKKAAQTAVVSLGDPTSSASPAPTFDAPAELPEIAAASGAAGKGIARHASPKANEAHPTGAPVIPIAAPKTISAHATRSVAALPMASVSMPANGTIGIPQTLTAATPAAAPNAAAPASQTSTASSPTPATPTALAAAITALHQTGQTTTILRLDPPGLGALSVHVGLGQSGQVNVLFVPSQPQTGQLLHAGIGELRQAMSASGLTLGQADISGQSGSQNGGGQPNAQNTPSMSGPQAEPPAPSTVSTAPIHGLSAYA